MEHVDNRQYRISLELPLIQKNIQIFWGIFVLLGSWHKMCSGEKKSPAIFTLESKDKAKKMKNRAKEKNMCYCKKRTEKGAKIGTFLSMLLGNLFSLHSLTNLFDDRKRTKHVFSRTNLIYLVLYPPWHTSTAK